MWLRQKVWVKAGQHPYSVHKPRPIPQTLVMGHTCGSCTRGSLWFGSNTASSPLSPRPDFHLSPLSYLKKSKNALPTRKKGKRSLVRRAPNEIQIRASVTMEFLGGLGEGWPQLLPSAAAYQCQFSRTQQTLEPHPNPLPFGSAAQGGPILSGITAAESHPVSCINLFLFFFCELHPHCD